MNTRTLLALVICVLCVVFLLAGCGASTPPPIDEQPPDIPPASTFVMDFSDFQVESADGMRVSSTTAGGFVGDTWLYAAGNVAVWNSVVVVTMAVPVAAFLESFNHVPVRQPDGSWEWSYSFGAPGGTYTARLRGDIIHGDVEWSMYISRQGAFSDVLWYTGVSDLPASEGSWTLNYDPDDPAPFIQIDWTRSLDTDARSTQYTNIDSESPSYGGYILATITDNEPFDASYQIYNQNADNLTEIEWSRGTYDGRVKDPAHFEGSDWHCWDETAQNIDCPE